MKINDLLIAEKLKRGTPQIPATAVEVVQYGMYLANAFNDVQMATKAMRNADILSFFGNELIKPNGERWTRESRLGK